MIVLHIFSSMSAVQNAFDSSSNIDAFLPYAACFSYHFVRKTVTLLSSWTVWYIIHTPNPLSVNIIKKNIHFWNVSYTVHAVYFNNLLMCGLNPFSFLSAFCQHDNYCVSFVPLSLECFLPIVIIVLYLDCPFLFTCCCHCCLSHTTDAPTTSSPSTTSPAPILPDTTGPLDSKHLNSAVTGNRGTVKPHCPSSFSSWSPSHIPIPLFLSQASFLWLKSAAPRTSGVFLYPTVTLHLCVSLLSS